MSFNPNLEFDYVPIGERKMEVLHFFHGFGVEILYLYHENNPPKLNFWKKNMLGPSYSRNLIALKICQKVTFGHSFDNNL